MKMHYTGCAVAILGCLLGGLPTGAENRTAGLPAAAPKHHKTHTKQLQKQETAGAVVALPLRAEAFVVSFGPEQPAQQPRGHALWMHLLKTYVNEDGLVDYARWRRSPAQLQAYLAWLRANMPAKGRPRAERLAYWINLYNAFTIDLVLRHYPVASIRDIPSPGVDNPWKIAFIDLPSGKLSLDAVENEVIRKNFAEPRIHFALVCAAISCPPLKQEAYLPGRLEAQLEAQAKRFLRDTRHNRVQGNQVQVSPIFDWFAADFTQQGTLFAYLSRYLPKPVPAGAKISYTNYDWGLNVQE